MTFVRRVTRRMRRAACRAALAGAAACVAVSGAARAGFEPSPSEVVRASLLSGDFTEALDRAQDLVVRSPASAEGYILAGLACFKLRRWDEAKQWFTAARTRASAAQADYLRTLLELTTDELKKQAALAKIEAGVRTRRITLHDAARRMVPILASDPGDGLLAARVARQFVAAGDPLGAMELLGATRAGVTQGQDAVLAARGEAERALEKIFADSQEGVIGSGIPPSLITGIKELRAKGSYIDEVALGVGGCWVIVAGIEVVWSRACPQGLRDVLAGEKSLFCRSIALGADGQWFVVLRDGNRVGVAPPGLGESIKAAESRGETLSEVALGPAGSFYYVTEVGQKAHSLADRDFPQSQNLRKGQ